MRRTHLSILRGLSVGVVAAALAACSSFGGPEPEPIQVSSQRLLDHRDSLAGKVASVSGYLVSAETIADRICLRAVMHGEQQVFETMVTRLSHLIRSL